MCGQRLPRRLAAIQKRAPEPCGCKFESPALSFFFFYFDVKTRENAC